MTSSCTQCSRRTVLKGLGLVVLSACGGDPTPPTGAATACGADLCLDLADPTNHPLATPGGSVAVDTSNDTILVARVSETQVVAASALCTHEGCENVYTASSMTYDCPCHGSQFSTTGEVLRGPARRALKTYTATLANNTITITLG